MNSTFENVANNMLSLITFGIAVCILSISVVICAHENEEFDKYNKKMLLKCLAKTFLSGAMFSVFISLIEIFLNYKS